MVVSADAVLPQISVLLGNGDGTFSHAADFPAGRLAVALAVADVDGDGDGDGHLDVVTADFGELPNVSVLLGNGDGTFQPPQQFFNGQSATALQVVDVGSQIELPEGSTALGAPDGKPDIVVANSGVALAISPVGGPEVVVLPGLFDEQDKFLGLGLPIQLIEGDAPQDLDVGDVNNDGAVDIVVVDRDGMLVIFGESPNIMPNNTPATARDLGTVVHLVDQTQTIVPGHQDAWFRLIVPTEAVAGGRDEILDFSALFEATEGAGLQMEVLDAQGNLLGTGERFRVGAAQGEQLLLHIFGVPDAGGNRGLGAYTLVIDVLPQVVSVDAQSLLPSVGDNPGGPTTSLVITLQGDRLDRITAENPNNYTVTSFGPDGVAGTADDRVIPVGGEGTADTCVGTGMEDTVTDCEF